MKILKLQKKKKKKMAFKNTKFAIRIVIACILIGGLAYCADYYVNVHLPMMQNGGHVQ